MPFRHRFASGLAAVLLAFLGLAVAGAASADVHLVRINEFYVQCDDGSTDVQYIELQDYDLDQFFRQCASLQIKRTVGGPDLLFLKPVFAGKSDGDVFAVGKTWLLATPAFQALTGITPDVLIPNGILPKAGGVIRFAADSGCAFNFGTIHEVAYGDQGPVAVPGPDRSMNWRHPRLSWVEGSPSPTTFAGASASSWTCQATPARPTTWSRLKDLYRD